MDGMNRSSLQGAKAAGGTSFVWLLTLLFVALKLTEAITWSWLWVFSPIWISWLIGLLLFGVCLAIAWSER